MVIGDGKRFRRHKRHNVELRVRYAGASGRVEQVVGNISLGGLRISGPISDTTGSQVELSLSLPHLPHPVKVHGEVVWVERDKDSDLATVGVRFLDLDPNLSVMLGHVLRSGLPS
jgi:uncharacterized protein (TIGR02266 family)